MNYKDLVNQFSWEEVKKHFEGDTEGIFNLAIEVCDKWAEDPNKIAILWEDANGNEEVWTFKRLKEKSNQMANALKSLGIKKGDRVAGLLGKDMELLVSIIAIFKLCAIYVPLFTAFGPDGIKHRLNDSGAQLLITNKEYATKIEEENVSLLLIDELIDGKTFWEFVDSFSSEFNIEKTLWNDPVIIQYTSGTTGLPKGAVVWHSGIYKLYPYFKYALHIEEEDVFFGGADLGWAYGLIACTLGPLSLGVKTVMYKGPFEPEKIFQILEKYEVTNFTYAPTAYRMMMALGKETIKKYNLKTKKFSSAGEPLDAEVIKFFKENFGRAIYDHYGATETSMIVNNYNILNMEIKPGSMGLPIPGLDIAIIDENGTPVKQGEVGQIALDLSTSAFGGYWNNPKKLEEKMLGKWFLTGDLAKQDEDGYYWFQGRADDVIVSAGYRIGPTEVEASLMEHPAVLEAAVVGKPDKVKGEVVKAFVVLNKGFEPTEALKEELSLFVRNKLSKHQYPKEIEFISEFPKTQSGKIQRYLLRKREYESINKV